MQSERYRMKYIEPIRGEERLPVHISRLPGDGTIRPWPVETAAVDAAH
jgi:hypothetical protein